MPNKSNKGWTEHDRRFIEDVARLLVPWGVPQTAARLYGYLLLNDKPVSLDRITGDLEISKSSASCAAAGAVHARAPPRRARQQTRLV